MPFPSSFLFVPGDRPDRFDKAVASGAHQVILDLEDAVAPGAKEGARRAVAAWAGRGEAVVRINGADTPWFADDLELARRSGLKKLMIPKAEPAAIKAVADACGAGMEVVALVESVAGVMQLRETCAMGGHLRLAFGNLDFALDAGMQEEARELDPIRLQLVLESRFARLSPPLDGVHPDIADAAGLAAQARRARNLGFGGKLCIHPAQVAVVNDAFRPAADELSWARRVLSAAEAAGGGAISVDGKMVDRPVLERARAILEAGS